MAYNYYPQYYSYGQQQIPMSVPQQTQPQIQNGGFISVRSEDEARSYPVAPGMSVMFIDESRQKVYTKTMGFSQLDRPMFYKYKLVKEDAQEPQNDADSAEPIDKPCYVEKPEFEALRAQFEALTEEIDKLKKKKGGEEK